MIGVTHGSASPRTRQLTPLPGCEMSIRDHYVSTFNAIERRCGDEPSNAKIGPSDSLPKTIRYTRRYVVKQTGEPHFRYQYYQKALSQALLRLPFESADRRRVVHLDIGCGPGVFSWVMYDHMASQGTRDPGSVDYYGYDHSAAMIKLAHLFLEGFPLQYEFHGFSDLSELSEALAEEDFSNCDVVVTFGYALLQVRDNTAALVDFAALIRCVFPSHSCIVVAADAHNNRERRAAFDDQCRALEAALNEAGVTLEERESPSQGSVMFARLKME